MIRSEKLCEGNLSTSLLEGSLSLCSFGCSAGFPHQDAQAQQSGHRLLLLSLLVSFREMDDDMKPEVKKGTRKSKNRTCIALANRVPCTHTCSEISYRITDVECIKCAKNTSVKSDRNGWMIRREKLCEGNLSTSLLEGLTSSDAAQSDCENPFKLKLSSKMTSTRGPHTKVQVLHLLRWVTHTHAPQQRGRCDDDENEVKVKMRWELLNQDVKRGTQEKRERANTNTTPKRAKNPGKARKKGKAKADGHGTRPAEEGEDRSAWTNLTKRNLSLPRHAQDPTYLKGGKRRNTWEREPMGAS